MPTFTFEEIRSFNESDWDFERSSEFLGYRNNKTGEWIYFDEYETLVANHSNYLLCFKTISDFRLDVLPFGQYPDCLLLNTFKER